MYLTESYWSYNVKDYILPFHKKLIGTVLLSPVVQDFQNTIRPYVFFIIQKRLRWMAQKWYVLSSDANKLVLWKYEMKWTLD